MTESASQVALLRSGADNLHISAEQACQTV